MSKPILLAVLAHPDDESFGMGGTLALYARRGVEVHLICATRGEVGQMDEDCLEGFDSIAERRVSELRCAAGILGLTGVHFLDYRDSGMPGTPDNEHPQALVMAPIEQVAGEVAHYIRDLKPQTDYELRVIASNLGGATTSPIIGFTTLAPPPPVIRNIVVKPEDTRAVVTFSLAEKGPARTEYREPGDSGWILGANETSSKYADHRQVIKPLQPETRYELRVIATNAGRLSASQPTP